MPERTTAAIFAVFLRLGLRCFGGPVAHIAYFRREFVILRGWLTERQFGDLLALCQFLPGPASSQLGMAVGLSRGGARGAVAAWLGFTLPSALIMYFIARGLVAGEASLPTGVLHGLLLVAVAVVAQAVGAMAGKFCDSVIKAMLALFAAAAVLSSSAVAAQVAVILVAGVLGAGGLVAGVTAPHEPLIVSVNRRVGASLLCGFFALLGALPLLARLMPSVGWQLVDSFYRAGALVFGGGHVVLPLLQREVLAHGWLPEATFLAGYGAAQALPGPLFTFAAFLGAATNTDIQPALGAALALLAIFTPSFLLVLGTAPFWDSVRKNARAQSALAAINAAVVGLLLAALYRPIGVTVLLTPTDWLVAAAALLALSSARIPVWLLVFAGALAGWLLR